MTGKYIADFIKENHLEFIDFEITSDGLIPTEYVAYLEWDNGMVFEKWINIKYTDDDRLEIVVQYYYERDDYHYDELSRDGWNNLGLTNEEIETILYELDFISNHDAGNGYVKIDQDTMPTWSKGKNLWIRNHITYANPKI